MMISIDDEPDKSVWIPEGEAILTPERIRQGGMKIEVNCQECGGAGKIAGFECAPCTGRGLVRNDSPTEYDIANVRYAQALVRNILNYLWQSEAITDQQHEDAATFQIWRDMHRTSRGHNRAVSSGDAESIGVRLRAHGYVLILRRLSLYDQDALEKAIDTFATEYTKHFAYKQRHLYRRAADRLSAILPPIKQQIDYLESLSDDERNSLSEERLKKIVAKGIENV